MFSAPTQFDRQNPYFDQDLPGHMGPEPPGSFKEGSRGQLYGKLTTRHHTLYTCPKTNHVRFLENLSGPEASIANIIAALDPCVELSRIIGIIFPIGVKQSRLV